MNKNCHMAPPLSIMDIYWENIFFTESSSGECRWRGVADSFCCMLACLPTTTMGTAGGYNGGNGAVTEGREGFPERIEIIGSNSGCTPPTYRFPSYA